jgi:hypothetical protein
MCLQSKVMESSTLDDPLLRYTPQIFSRMIYGHVAAFRKMYWKIHHKERLLRRLGGVVVSVLATGPKVCGFKTRPRRWIFMGDKNPQHTFLSDGK